MRRIWIATVGTAIVALFVMPMLASTLVRSAIERDSARDRRAFASGTSPWHWTFTRPDDIVASRVFGAGLLLGGPGKSLQRLYPELVPHSLTLVSSAPSPMEFGLPLARPPNLRELPVFRLDASATAAGTYGLTVRKTLSSEPVQARLGSFAGGELSRTFRLDQLTWTDSQGRAAPMPENVAMLRMTAVLPAAQTLTLRAASLAPLPGSLLIHTTALPRSPASAETLLAWRDAQQERSALVLFGEEPPTVASPSWRAWGAPALYALLLVAAQRRRTPSQTPVRALLDAALVLAGPLWFIGTLQFSSHPGVPGMATFLLGAAFAASLALRGHLERASWIGSGRAAVWPLLAIAAAAVIALVAGHPPVWPTAGRALVYLAWALFQQWMMLAVAGTLLARALPRPVAVLCTALAFALLHTPNGTLMQLCFVAELGWAWWFLRHRALLPVAVAHAASALLLQACVAGGALRSLEVSARFLN